MILDISPKISPRTGVFPGDVPFSRHITCSFAQGAGFDLSSITTTLHIGAHVDAPSHYHPDGVGIDAVDLDLYWGPAQVIDVSHCRGSRVNVHDIRVDITQPRVLLKTLSFPDPDRWNSDFKAITPELINFLAQKGVKLIGIDTPSVDTEDSKELPAHKEIYRRRLAILEGIVLAHVAPGIYELVALPLPLVGGDASPVRALLRSANLVFSDSG